jgi:hypothetical protein
VFNFVATGSSMPLTINGISVPAGNEFLGLDNVLVAGVAAVPEPETYALFLAGLAALGSFARRRGRR